MIKSNNSVKFAIILLLIILFTGISGQSFLFAKDAPGITVSFNKKSYSPGESGVMTLNFKTTSKVKIPKDPEVTINITSGNIEGQGLQDYSGGEGDYISNSKVKYNFVVPADAQSGSTITVTGTANFGYCTTVDGVCRLASKEFSGKFKVK